MKTALVTGGSRGIGLAIALELGRSGYAVAIMATKPESAYPQSTQKLREAGVSYSWHAGDIANTEDRLRVVDEVAARHGRIDVLVCNAGIARQELFTDITEASWREVMGVDLDGVFYCAQAVLPDMLHRKAGKIITLSSMWGQVGASCEVAYSTAKAGVIGLTKALAKELGPSGITVNCVAPGVIDTEMNGNLPQDIKDELAEETPLERLGTPEDVAQAVWFLASPAGDFFTGQVLAPNGGLII
jgi:3-oxoacyl-[acyl-carrier protein] reductase